MCKTEYINIVTGEKLDLSRVDLLPNNAMLKVKPELWIEWDFEKNGELGFDIWKVTFGSGKKVWWICEKGHSSYAVIGSKCKGYGCVYCAGQRILVGENDMWTVNPKLASMLLNSDDGYKYGEGSNEKLDWICQSCNSIVKNKTVSYVKNKGLPCNICGDGISYPEKLMSNVLSFVEDGYVVQKTFEWSKGKIYDVYIENLKMIIEIHGTQHYKESAIRGSRSLKEELENDKLKFELAKKNGIERYVVIDARKSKLQWIKNSILNSELSNIYNLENVDWENAHELSLNSLIAKACSIYNDESNSIKYICDKLKMSKPTIIEYLKKGNIAGLCVYNTTQSTANHAERISNKVVQLDLNGNYINTYNSVRLASKETKAHEDSIAKVCRGKFKQTKGYKWMYKEDYDEYISDSIKTIHQV